MPPTSANHSGQPIILATPEDIARFADSVGVLSRPRVETIRLPDRMEGSHLRVALSRKIRWLANDCGCAAGSVVLLVTLGALVVLADVDGWALIAIPLTAAVAAKFLSLLVTWWWLHRLLARLTQRLK